MSRPFAIAVAPNGARRGKADHPRLPMTAGEIARDAAEAKEAGAAMIHLHVRDREGRHTLDAGRYRDAIHAVRAAVGDGMVVQVTTEAVGRYPPEEQMAVVDALRPESVSIALREILPEGGDEWAVASLFARMDRMEILHQVIIYDPADLARLEALSRRGVLPDGPHAVLAVLGRYADQGATEAEFDAFLAAGLGRHAWMLCAFGEREAAFMERAARAGGHARVGFENNLRLPDGGLAPSNAAIVAATAVASSGSGRSLASAAELRANWRIPGGAAEETPVAAARPARRKLGHGVSGQ
jgi:uncharacterized protein (DUF849 family)